MLRHIVTIGQVSFNIWADRYTVSLCGRPFEFFTGETKIAEVPPGEGKSISVRQVQMWEKI